MTEAGNDPGAGRSKAGLAWLPALAWMALIFLASAQPDFDFAPDIWQSDPVTLTVHTLEFGVLAVLLWRAASRTRALRRHATAFALAGAALYGLSDEVHQLFVPGRIADWRDWLADVVGALIALLLVAWLRRRV